MENLKIKITGGGSREEVSNALDLISKAIRNTPVEDLDGSEWEDCTLMTEIESTGYECDSCGAEIEESDLYCRNCGDENF